jgi:DNA-binding PadR family transcriptional regulator
VGNPLESPRQDATLRKVQEFERQVGGAGTIAEIFGIRATHIEYQRVYQALRQLARKELVKTRLVSAGISSAASRVWELTKKGRNTIV